MAARTLRKALRMGRKDMPGLLKAAGFDLITKALPGAVRQGRVATAGDAS
jgi:hypothetical protein